MGGELKSNFVEDVVSLEEEEKKSTSQSRDKASFSLLKSQSEHALPNVGNKTADAILSSHRCTMNVRMVATSHCSGVLKSSFNPIAVLSQGCTQASSSFSSLLERSRSVE